MDIYTRKGIRKEIDEEGIDDSEEGFMIGYLAA